MNNLIRRTDWDHKGIAGHEQLLTREWLVTNGLGGYASGTVAGVPTRRYHGLLIAALAAPEGRTMTLAHLSEQIRLRDGQVVRLGGQERAPGDLRMYGADDLVEFRLEMGMPVWRYEIGGLVLEKQLLMPHEQNTVHVTYRLVSGEGPVRLKIMPSVHFRHHDAPVSTPLPMPFRVVASQARYEVYAAGHDRPVHLRLHGEQTAFTLEEKTIPEMLYRIEEHRGYESVGDLWSPGYFRVDLAEGRSATFIASTEPWDTIEALEPDDVLAMERERRVRLVQRAVPQARAGVPAELVLAADQFIITPAGRTEDTARVRAAGDEPRTIIAGYHWFTDWGRDTMISLEGLTLTTGRHTEAGYILRTFAHYIKQGLIPNMFPEAEKGGLYNTADATLWFFHAIDRYLAVTDDRATLSTLIPRLLDIVDHHLRGTLFGIHVDPRDGLLSQGAEGYQVTWMDAKVGDWVVTPRRGKAVEINALWYNALRLLEGWLRDEDRADDADRIAGHARRAFGSFNERFWYDEGNYLYDVIDVIDGDRQNDPAMRPNQLFAISLEHPVLERDRWERVLTAVREHLLLTPVGLRSLAPDHPEYKPIYFGDLRARDAAYHQGTVWGWLVGPLVDAWLKVYPDDLDDAHAFLEGFVDHLGEACIGSISEIFDAEAPFTPRGCIAQAWSVAEVLRCWVKIEELRKTRSPGPSRRPPAEAVR